MKEEHMGDILNESKAIADAAFKEHRNKELSSEDYAEMLADRSEIANFIRVVGGRVAAEEHDKTSYNKDVSNETVVAKGALSRMDEVRRRSIQNSRIPFKISGNELLAISGMMQDSPARGNVEEFREFQDASDLLVRMEERYMDHTTPKIAPKRKLDTVKNAASLVRQKFKRK